MTHKVKGFLAADGTFFEGEAECERYEIKQLLTGLCESHDVNPENFFGLLREWNSQIKGYYNADAKCKEPEAIATGGAAIDDVPPDEEYHPDFAVGDKDAPGFLEQSFRRHK